MAWIVVVLLGACGSTEEPIASSPPEPERDDDRDGDFILDRCDECPDEPEPYNLTLDHDGCPEEVIIESSRHASVRSLYFDHDSGELAERSTEHLQFVSEELSDAHAESILCTGEAAPSETDPVELSQRRAEHVCARLRAAGIAQRATTHGYGVRARTGERPEENLRRVVVTQLDGRLTEHWYQPLYVFARWDGEQLHSVDRLEHAEPTGPPRCPEELGDP